MYVKYDLPAFVSLYAAAADDRPKPERKLLPIACMPYRAMPAFSCAFASELLL